jgi:hypothetical protein
MSNNIYNILGKLKGITDNAALTPDTEATTVYESVDARGSITEAVKSLEAKYQTFKEAKAKPDFLDVDKDGDKKEPMKQAVKEKKAEPFSSDDYDEYGVRHSSSFNQPPKKAVKDKNNAKGAFNDMFGGDANDLTSKLKIKEGMDDLTDLDSYQFADPDTDTAVKPATAKQAAAEKRRRLQDIEDRKAAKDDWFSGKDAEPNVRIHRAKYQDEPESELEESIKFGDKIANNKAEMKKAKLAKIKESRVMEETDYFYEKVGKALAEKDSTLDTSTGDFKMAVR